MGLRLEWRHHESRRNPPNCGATSLSELPLPEGDTQAARLRSYETLIDVSRMLLSSASLDELFERVTSELSRLVGYDAITIYGVDEVRGMVIPLHSVDMWADEIMASPLRIGEGLTGFFDTGFDFG